MTASKTTPVKIFELFLISFLSLFLELAVIRWLPGVFAALAYFTNLILIASFLGLGVGCASCRKPFAHFPAVVFLVMVTFAALFQKIGVSYHAGISDFIFLKNQTSTVPLWLAVPVMFVLVFIFFRYVGIILGRCMEYFPPLISYSINIFSSIAGIAVFTALSFFFAPPAVWFGVGLAGLFWFLRDQWKTAVPAIVTALIVVMTASEGQIWTPYYKLELARSTPTEYFHLSVNNHYQQQALKLTDPHITDFHGLNHWRMIYSLPYMFSRPQKALIVGAGLGNDVLTAAQENVPQIHAVELDPGILRIGKTLRPDRPYANPGVTVIIDDARSYMNTTQERYDLIVYGFLDSHALFNNMSGVRLDNFVYTLEGLSRARELLTDDGQIALSFYVGKPWVGQRIFYMLRQVFGKSPLVYVSQRIPTEQIFIISKNRGEMATREISGFTETSTDYAQLPPPPLTTDNWPYFYLKDRAIPAQYLWILGLILAISAGTTGFSLRKQKDIVSYAPFFFLGVAFMLIETKSIVHLSLVFGTTWLVNAVVITGILLMILLANLYVMQRRGKSLTVMYSLLAASLVVNWLVNPGQIPSFTGPGKVVAAVLLAVIPLFFAAIIFASLFKNVRNVSVAFGLNLLGVVLGGLLEYLSLCIGLNNLALLALALYAMSSLGHRRFLA